jgi:hypothetical protein
VTEDQDNDFNPSADDGQLAKSNEVSHDAL